MNAGKRISHDRNLWISPLLAPNLWITADTFPRIHRAVDRKSTRLNSSHGYISYAVFCLKKKKHKHQIHSRLEHERHNLIGKRTSRPDVTERRCGPPCSGVEHYLLATL